VPSASARLNREAAVNPNKRNMVAGPVFMSTGR
jgi:hypothetical protein